MAAEDDEPVDTGPIYLVDTLAFTASELAPLFSLLEASTPQKVVFDGRMDYCELYHAHAVEMKGVYDLQLAEIILREDEDDAKLRRLSQALFRRNWPSQLTKFKGVDIHVLPGLYGCMRDHGFVQGSRPGKLPEYLAVRKCS